MKLQDIRNDKDYFTSTLSGFVRQLNFAGIAIVWIFRVAGKNGQVVLDSGLLVTLLCFIGSLFADFLHYLYASMAWSIYFRYLEDKRNLTLEDEVEAPIWINWPSIVFFYSKTVLTGLGYYLLYLAVMDKIG